MRKASGLAYCIKVLIESIGESFRVSRTFFQGGNSMTDGGDNAMKEGGNLSLGGSLTPERQPAD